MTLLPAKRPRGNRGFRRELPGCLQGSHLFDFRNEILRRTDCSGRGVWGNSLLQPTSSKKREIGVRASFGGTSQYVRWCEKFITQQSSQATACRMPRQRYFGNRPPGTSRRRRSRSSQHEERHREPVVWVPHARCHAECASESMHKERSLTKPTTPSISPAELTSVERASPATQ